MHQLKGSQLDEVKNEVTLGRGEEIRGAQACKEVKVGKSAIPCIFGRFAPAVAVPQKEGIKDFSVAVPFWLLQPLERPCANLTRDAMALCLEAGREKKSARVAENSWNATTAKCAASEEQECRVRPGTDSSQPAPALEGSCSSLKIGWWGNFSVPARGELTVESDRRRNRHFLRAALTCSSRQAFVFLYFTRLMIAGFTC